MHLQFPSIMEGSTGQELFFQHMRQFTHYSFAYLESGVALHSAYCIVWLVYGTVHTVSCGWCSVQCILYRVAGVVYSAYGIVWLVYGTVHTKLAHQTTQLLL